MINIKQVSNLLSEIKFSLEDAGFKVEEIDNDTEIGLVVDGVKFIVIDTKKAN